MAARADLPARLSGGPVAPPSTATGPAVDAVVKWFKADKGYGFVELANGQGDAFLHANALHASGHDSVPPGAKLRVQVGAGAKGAQVTRVPRSRHRGGGRAGAPAVLRRRAAPAAGGARPFDGRQRRR